jgi:hypothetical protein
MGFRDMGCYNSRLAPKRVASRRVMAVVATTAAVAKPPRCRVRACTPPLSCLALTRSAWLRIALMRAPIKQTPPPCHCPHPHRCLPPVRRHRRTWSLFLPRHWCRAASPTFRPRVQVPEHRRAPELLPDQLKSLLPRVEDLVVAHAVAACC